MRNCASSLRCVHNGWEDMILPDFDDPCNCADPRHLRQSEWDHKLGKIECVFSLYDKMRWKWDDIYLLQGLANIYSPSLDPPPLPMYFRTPDIAPWRYTWRLWTSELGDALGGRNRESLEIHLKPVMEGVWRCTCRPWSSELGDALGGRNHVNLEPVIEHFWRYTWRRWSSELRDALRDGDQASLEIDFEALIVRTWWP